MDWAQNVANISNDISKQVRLYLLRIIPILQEYNTSLNTMTNSNLLIKKYKTG